MNFKNVLFALLGLMLLCGINFAAEGLYNEDTIILYYGVVGGGSSTNANCSGQYDGSAATTLVWNTFNISNDNPLMPEFYGAIANASRSGVANGTTVIICKNMSNFHDYGWALPATVNLNGTGSSWDSATGFNIAGNESDVFIYGIVPPVDKIFNVSSNNTNISNFSFGDSLASQVVLNSTNVKLFSNTFNASSIVNIKLANESRNISIYNNIFQVRDSTVGFGIDSLAGFEHPNFRGEGFTGINITNNVFNGTSVGSFVGTAINAHKFYNPIIVNNNFSRTLWGVFLNYTQLGGNLSGNRFINVSQALYLSDANRTNVSLGAFEDNVGELVSSTIYIANSSYNNFSSFTIQGNATALYGIYLIDASQNNTFYNLTIYNLSSGEGGFGIYAVRYAGHPVNNTVKNCNISRLTVGIATASPDWKIYNNTIYNVWQAINLSATAMNHSVVDNTMYNCSNGTEYGCVHASNSVQSGTVIYNNRIENSSIGFDMDIYMGSSNLGTFWNNTVIGSSLYGIRVINYLFNFSGTNYVYNTSVSGYDVYVNGTGNFSTGNYNLSTEYLSYTVANATNVTIKAINLTTAGFTYTIGTLSNVTLPSGNILEYAHLMSMAPPYAGAGHFGLNVTNLSDRSASKMSLTMYYTSESRYYADYVGIAVNQSLSANNWNLFAPNLWVTTKNSVYSENLTAVPTNGNTFAIFTLVGYRFGGSSSATSTGGLAGKNAVELSKTFTCSDGKLLVTVSPVVSGIKVKLFSLVDYTTVSGTTDSDGKVSFTITKDGVYQLDSESTSGYLAGSVSDFELKLCPGATPVTTPVTTVTEETTTEVITETPTEEQPPVITTSSVTKEEVLIILTSADEVIVLAVKENKDVSSAKAKISEANVLIASGDFEGAKLLAEEALALAKSAKAKAAAATTTTTTPATTTTAKPTQQGMDLGTILLIGAVVVIVIVGIYYFTRSKGGYKGQKGQRRF